jgi:hypothetical protein
MGFTVEGWADGEGLNARGDLPYCSPSDYAMERYLIGESVFFNLPWESAQHIARHFESYRRATPPSAMAVFVLHKRAKFNDLT